MGKATPDKGGCWFCHDDSEPLLYEDEFDTLVHRACIRRALEADPDHPEASLMQYLLVPDKRWDSGKGHLPHNTGIKPE